MIISKADCVMCEGVGEGGGGEGCKGINNCVKGWGEKVANERGRTLQTGGGGVKSCKGGEGNDEKCRIVQTGTE